MFSYSAITAAFPGWHRRDVAAQSGAYPLAHAGSTRSKLFSAAAAAAGVLALPIMTFCGVNAAAAAGLGLGAASTSAPACSTVLVPGSAWLSGMGVDVHSNGWAQGTGYSCNGTFSQTNPQVQDGWAWQCVELATRLYAVRGWGYVHGDASQIPQDAGLIAHPNGSAYEPVPGDLIVEGGNPGHVAVIDHIVNTTIYAVEQNASGTGWHTYTENGFTITGGYGPVIDIMHSPANHHTVDVGVVLSHNGPGGYTLAPDGTVTPFGGALALPGTGVALWPGQDNARGIVLRGDDKGGYVLDLYGGLHPFGNAPAMTGGPYWPGFDIARGMVLRSDNAGGYVLDGWGGIHPFGNAPALGGTAYWPNWDIARGMVLRSDNAGGYVLDGWGGIHPFGNAPALGGTAYWPNWDIARAIVLRSDDLGGYVLDGWGGIQPFGNAPAMNGTAYWKNQDVARGIAINYTGSTGMVIDTSGFLHPVTVSKSGCPTCS